MLSRIFFLLLVSTSLFAGKPDRYLSVCAIFRDEARFLKEWIEYHRMVGVEHFYLFNHQSADHYREVLDPYIRKGIVELSEVRGELYSLQELANLQVQVYNEILPRACKETKWLAIIDIDEFITRTNGGKLPPFLKKYEKFGGLIINWQMYGTSNIARIGKNELMMEKLVHKMKTHHRHNRHIKTIFQPKKILSAHVHIPKFKEGYFPVNEKKKRHDEKRGLSKKVSVDKIQITHYSERDEDHFYNVKAPLRTLWFPPGEAPEFHPHEEFNEVYDDLMLQFVPKLKKRIRKQ